MYEIGALGRSGGEEGAAVAGGSRLIARITSRIAFGRFGLRSTQCAVAMLGMNSCEGTGSSITGRIRLFSAVAYCASRWHGVDCRYWVPMTGMNTSADSIRVSSSSHQLCPPANCSSKNGSYPLLRKLPTSCSTAPRYSRG